MIFNQLGRLFSIESVSKLQYSFNVLKTYAVHALDSLSEITSDLTIDEFKLWSKFKNVIGRESSGYFFKDHRTGTLAH